MVNYIETPNEKELLAMREKYKAGTRVCLTKMDDAYAPPIGTCGTVSHVDDTGSIFVNWDKSYLFATCWVCLGKIYNRKPSKQNYIKTDWQYFRPDDTLYSVCSES